MSDDTTNDLPSGGLGLGAVLSNGRYMLETMIQNLRADTTNWQAHALNVASIIVGVAIVTRVGGAWTLLGWLFILGAIVGFADAIVRRVRA